MSKLAINMEIKYSEAKLPKNFCANLVQKATKLIDSSISFSVLALPGVGSTVFFKYLMTHTPYHFVYVDIHKLANITLEDFYKLFLKQLGGDSHEKSEEQIINEIEQKLIGASHNKIVIIFNHFNLLKSEFSPSLFNNLRNFRSINRDNIVMVFNSSQPLETLIPVEIRKENMHLLSKSIYLKPYTLREIEEVINVFPKDPDLDQKYVQYAINLSGGHYFLLQILLKSERQENPLLDPFVNLFFKDLFQSLNYKDRKTVEKIANDKTTENIDPFLLNVGLLNEVNGKPQFFSLLFKDYLNKKLPLKLSKIENKIFKILKENEGKIIDKDRLFEEVWGNEVGSDWALNSAIYRIRKNPAFAQLGYNIESYKKQGYRLIKE